MWGFLAKIASAAAPFLMDAVKSGVSKVGQYLAGSVIKPIQEQGFIRGLATGVGNIARDISGVATSVAPMVQAAGQAVSGISPGLGKGLGDVAKFVSSVGEGAARVGRTSETVGDFFRPRES